MTAAGL